HERVWNANVSREAPLLSRCSSPTSGSPSTTPSRSAIALIRDGASAPWLSTHWTLPRDRERRGRAAHGAVGSGPADSWASLSLRRGVPEQGRVGGLKRGRARWAARAPTGRPHASA